MDDDLPIEEMIELCEDEQTSLADWILLFFFWWWPF
jgi:hypothetical protein